jgi:hypothetical protein
MRRSTRCDLWERVSHRTNVANSNDAVQEEADDADVPNTSVSVFGDMLNNPVMDVYDLPDERLCSVDTPVLPDHKPLARFPRPSISVDLDGISDRTHLQVFLPSAARFKLRSSRGGGAAELLLSGSDHKVQKRRWQALDTDLKRGY